MRHYSEDEKALIESFRANGGERTIFFRQGKPRLSKAEAKALARLIRSGRVERRRSGDFGWVLYALKEAAGPTP